MNDHTVYDEGRTEAHEHREVALWAYRMGEHPRGTDAEQRLYWAFLNRYDAVGTAETPRARAQVAALRS